VRAADSLAWYQLTSTYSGEQDSFHRRHLVTPMAKQLMNLNATPVIKATTRAKKPRALGDGATPQADAGFTLRKQVNPETDLPQVSWPVPGQGDHGPAQAFAYEPYPTDDQLTTVVTSCDHNCGSRHMLVAHKKGDVIVRLSTDDGRYQAGGAFGKDTVAVPQLRACLRGRSYRSRLYSPERLLYPMMRVGERGEGKFKRVSWDEALDHIAKKMVELKAKYGPTAILDQAYAGTSYGVLHKSDQIEGLLARFLGMFGCRTNSWSVPSYQGTTFSSRMTFGTIEDGNEDDAFAHSKLIIMWGWNPAYTFHGGNTFYYMRWPSSAAASSSWSIRSTPIRPPPTMPGGFRSSPTPTPPCWPAWRTTSSPTICRTRSSSTSSCRAWMPAPCRTGPRPGELQGLHPRQTTRRRRRRSGPRRSAACRRPTSGSWPTCTPAPSRRR
jgi:hypothetical protein